MSVLSRLENGVGSKNRRKEQVAWSEAECKSYHEVVEVGV